MKIHGFGRYPCIDGQILSPTSSARCRKAVIEKTDLIARGLGRSYGDSSLSEHMLSLQYLDQLLIFDEHIGVITCSGAATLDEILRLIVPKGWFLPVTPGTRFVTAGGALASNVHGKNHRVQGSFGDHVIAIELLLGNGECISISRTQHPDLFAATCGGMGLTGIILKLQIQLMPITSTKMQTSCIQAPSLDVLLDHFEEHAKQPYRVAWLDALACGKHLGRGVLRLGEHADQGSLLLNDPKPRTLHYACPDWFLNAGFIKGFNFFYYHLAAMQKKQQGMLLFPFFYPLDNLLHWNRLYGKTGLLQYQCVLPERSAREGLHLLLSHITQSRLSSFLAVLKQFGDSSSSYLSFPQRGFTLALDFKAVPVAFELMNRLDDIVRDYGGRLYLAKDARMSAAMFKASYPEWEAFEAIRVKYHAAGVFSSLQSKRLGLL